MRVPKTKEMKVRVPPRIKQAFQALASQDLTSESAVARVALMEYLRLHAPIYLKDEPACENVSSSTPAVDQEAKAATAAAYDAVAAGEATSRQTPSDEQAAKPRRRKGKK